MPIDYSVFDALAPQRDARFDTAGVFAENELKQVIAQTYDRMYAELDAKMHIPVRTDINYALPAWSYDSYDKTGKADFLAAVGDDIPGADVSKKRMNFPIQTIVSQYGWALEEIEAARVVGMSLDSARADACRRAIAELENSILLNGSVNFGLPGFLTNDATPLMAAITGAWLGSTTGDQMCDDLQALVDSIVVNSNGLHHANTVLLPIAHYRKMAAKRLTDTNISAMEYFKQQNPEIREIKMLKELKTAGVSSVPRAMAYQKDPMVLSGIVPLAFQQMPPVQRGAFRVEVPCRSRQGGCVWTYPMGGAVMDGI